MDTEDMDLLYGDLDARSNISELEKLRKQCDDYASKICSLETELKEALLQNSSILRDKDNLERNMVALYNTAVVEIGRKDRELTELRDLIARTGAGIK